MTTTHQYSDCSFCGGTVKEEHTDLDYRYRGNLYIFQNVPAGVCQQCGEKYLTADVAKRIEQKIKTNERWEKTIPVPVEDFSEVSFV
ncbi:MAG: type II toxin-antitoxin system MqsA family antitoxin [Bacteroidetes bacterium]|nr:MAG: type II toxin-antitoxin system MqsA family antitoxin [Bacteroidota bacterium]